MRRFLLILLSVFIFLSGTPVPEGSAIDININFGNKKEKKPVKKPPALKENEKRYFTTLAKQFSVPGKRPSEIHAKGISIEEVAVVLYLAKKAKVKPDKVIKSKKRNKTWLKTTRSLGRDPKLYYVKLSTKLVKGPPKGNAFRDKFLLKPKAQWGKLKISDKNIVDLVNLKAISGFYSFGSDDIVELRRSGRGYPFINDEIKRLKKAQRRAPAPKSAAPAKARRSR